MVQDGIIWDENQDWQDEIVFESLASNGKDATINIALDGSMYPS
jgi:hypothetical protein